MSDNNKSIFSIGFLDLLGLVFVILKLTGVIDWSWWYVLMPIYLPYAVIFALAVLIVCLGYRSSADSDDENENNQ